MAPEPDSSAFLAMDAVGRDDDAGARRAVLPQGSGKRSRRGIVGMPRLVQRPLDPYEQPIDVPQLRHLKQVPLRTVM